MKRVIEPLFLMGSKIESVDGRLPLTIHGGPLKGIDYEMPVASAQVKSCLLLAGLLADGQTTVRESTPTRDHTERMLGWFGVDVDDDNGAASVNGGDTLRARGLSVPGDMSSAAFFIIAAICLPGSDLCIPNVGLNPTRADLLKILTALGADIELKEQTTIGNEPSGTIQVRGGLPASPREQPYRLSGSAIPGIIDELPILAVLGTQIDGGLEVRDAGELRLKESDRIASVVENLRRIGALVDDQADGFFVRKSKLAGAVVDSFGDHRIAMAFAVAGLLADGVIEIRGAECVEISFPGFFDVLAGVTGSDG
jgi:3-phosphoshikimate 1-carboxyvinyltransferase